MLFYLSIILSSTFFIYLGSRSNKSQKKFLYFLGLLIPVFFATFRDITVGKDTEIYIDLYNAYSSASGFNQILMMLDIETFFVVSTLIGKIWGGYKFVFFSYSFLTFLFVLLSLDKYSKYLSVWLGYIVFMFLFYNASLNIMRQILAVAYLLYSSTFLFSGYKKKYLVLLAFSLAIHMTTVFAGSLLYIIYLISVESKYKKKFYKKLYIFALIAIFFMVNVIITFMAHLGFGNSYAYVRGMDPSVISTTDVIISLLLIYIAYKSMVRKEISVLSPDVFFLVSVTCLMLFLTGYYNMWLSRMAYYMLVFACVFVPMLAKSPKLKKYRKVYPFAISFTAFSYWLYIIVISGSNQTIPYVYN